MSSRLNCVSFMTLLPTDRNVAPATAPWVPAPLSRRLPGAQIAAGDGRGFDLGTGRERQPEQQLRPVPLARGFGQVAHWKLAWTGDQLGECQRLVFRWHPVHRPQRAKAVQVGN